MIFMSGHLLVLKWYLCLPQVVTFHNSAKTQKQIHFHNLTKTLKKCQNKHNNSHHQKINSLADCVFVYIQILEKKAVSGVGPLGELLDPPLWNLLHVAK